MTPPINLPKLGDRILTKIRMQGADDLVEVTGKVTRVLTDAIVIVDQHLVTHFVTDESLEREGFELVEEPGRSGYL